MSCSPVRLARRSVAGVRSRSMRSRSFALALSRPSVAALRSVSCSSGSAAWIRRRIASLSSGSAVWISRRMALVAVPARALEGLRHEIVDLLSHLGGGEPGLEALHRGLRHVPGRLAQRLVLDEGPAQRLPEGLLDRGHAVCHATHGALRRGMPEAVDVFLGHAAAETRGEEQGEGGGPGVATTVGSADAHGHSPGRFPCALEPVVRPRPGRAGAVEGGGIRPGPFPSGQRGP